MQDIPPSNFHDGQSHVVPKIPEANQSQISSLRNDTHISNEISAVKATLSGANEHAAHHQEMLQQLAWNANTVMTYENVGPTWQSLLQTDSLPNVISSNSRLDTFYLEMLINQTGSDIRSIWNNAMTFGYVNNNDMEAILTASSPQYELLHTLINAVDKHIKKQMFSEQFPQGDIALVQSLDSRIRTASNLLKYSGNLFTENIDLKSVARVDYNNGAIHVNTAVGDLIVPFAITDTNTISIKPGESEIIPRKSKTVASKVEGEKSVPETAITTENYHLLGMSLTCMEQAIATTFTDETTTDYRILDRNARFQYARNLAASVDQSSSSLSVKEQRKITDLIQAYKPNSPLDQFEKVAEIVWKKSTQTDMLYQQLITDRLINGDRLESVLYDVARGAELAYDLGMTSVPLGSLAEKFIEHSVTLYRLQQPINDYARDDAPDAPFTITKNDLHSTIQFAQLIAERAADMGKRWGDSGIGGLLAEREAYGSKELHNFLEKEGMLVVNEGKVVLAIPEMPRTERELPALPVHVESMQRLSETELNKRTRQALDQIEELFPESQRTYAFPKGKEVINDTRYGGKVRLSDYHKVNTAKAQLATPLSEQPDQGQVKFEDRIPYKRYEKTINRQVTLTRRYQTEPGNPATYVQDTIHLEETGGILGLNKQVRFIDASRKLIDDFGSLVEEKGVVLTDPQEILQMTEDVIEYANQFKNRGFSK